MLITEPEHIIRLGGLTAIAVIVFVETGLLVGFFLPGDSLLVTAGLLASQGMLDLGSLLVIVTLMAILGDATGFWIGTRFGPALERRPDSRLFRREHLLRTQVFYEVHGGKTIVIARFMPIVRTFAPVVAGIARMPYRRFALFNVAGGILWVFSMLLTGYLLGQVIPGIGRYLEIVIVVVVALSLLPGFIHAAKARREGRARSARLISMVLELVDAIHESLAAGMSRAALAPALAARFETHETGGEPRERIAMKPAAADGAIEARLESIAPGGHSPARRELAHRFLAGEVERMRAALTERFGPPVASTEELARWALADGILELRLDEPAGDRDPGVNFRFLPLSPASSAGLG